MGAAGIDGWSSGRRRRRGCLEQWQEECRAEEQLPDLVVEDEVQGLRVEERQPDLGGGGVAARSGADWGWVRLREWVRTREK